jgi:hypothetical protein
MVRHWTTEPYLLLRNKALTLPDRASDQLGLVSTLRLHGLHGFPRSHASLGLEGLLGSLPKFQMTDEFYRHQQENQIKH